MKNLASYLFGLSVLLALPALSFAAGKSVYGADNRLEYYEAPPAIQALSQSIVSLWNAGKVVENKPSGKYDLVTTTLGEANGLCPGERFFSQLTGAFCSGSLVGEDLVMTAGHCITTEARCASTKLVFGFKVARAGDNGAASVDRGEVYGCSRIVARYKAGEPGTPFPEGQTLGADYALIKLDRKVAGHAPLAINRGAAIKKDVKIFVMGYPSGLPLKIAGDAKVRDAGKAGYFVADLDTFGGNSGSAVFNMATNKIEGILVRGAGDYEEDETAGCSRTAVYAQDGGRGEDVTSIAALAALVPPLPGEKAAPAAAKTVDVDTSGLKREAARPASVKFH